MIFYSIFKTLVGHEVAVELKNDVAIVGKLHNIDQYLNVKLLEAKVVDPQRYPQLTAMTSIFIRGSVVRYITIPKEHVDVELMQDAAAQVRHLVTRCRRQRLSGFPPRTVPKRPQLFARDHHHSRALAVASATPSTYVPIPGGTPIDHG
eukprot:CAMPEP_0197395216 /NCGR_PEP_ID=MMETSP1165-20131217/6500_1 /TAXON_ID=284809 /ORGANISM="Chrysocystis fragilis, Strain CCMP3189" /LENGTH=148 /DNA_ID=CAMNT_0042920967 /DNA_START=31 /DNA_END=472 /DNA_ORIENTATION=+